MSTYLITGATGNTGKPVALGLLAAGHTVRIISRNGAKAKALTDKGAILFTGDTTDSALVTNALTGVDAAYFMVPGEWAAPDFTAAQLKHVNAFAAAAKSAGLKKLVTLSSVGAHLPEGNGVVNGLYHMEQAMNAIPGLDVLHLRATYFMENTLGQTGVIKHMGFMGTPVKADLKMPMVATRDIADKALQHLIALDFSGKGVEYVLGPRDLTYNEAAFILGSAIGKPDLHYVEFTYDQAEQAMMQQLGAGASVARRMMEFVQCLNAGHLMETVQRTASNTTPTDLKDFAATFKAVYEMN